MKAVFSSSLFHVVALAIVTGFTGCHVHGQQDKLSSIGLIESVIGRNEVHRAMDIVNELIESKNLKKILCGWESKSFNEAEFYYFLTQPDGLPLKTVAQTSKENNSIFISSSWRSICDETFRLSDADSVLRTHTLVFILLHELGHLLGEKAYYLAESRQVQLDSFLLKNPNSMKDELAADFFAAEVVRDNKTKISEQLRGDLEELYSRVDYYYYSRYDVHMGGLRIVLSEPAKRFGDLSYSHPNLNLRMHLISFLVDPTPEKLHRLQWIEEQRKLFFDVDTFTPDVMDRLEHLRNLPDGSTENAK